MTREEYLKQEEKDFDNLDLKNAIRLVKLYNNSARKYFHNWQETEKELEILKFKLQKLEQKQEDNHESLFCEKCIHNYS